MAIGKPNDILVSPIFNSIEFDPRFDFVLLEDKHVDETIDLFTRVFCDDEPMTRYIHMDYSSFTPFAERVVLKAVKDGFSGIATRHNKIVAVGISEDMMEPLPMNFSFDPKFNYIFTLLESLGKDFFSDKTFMPNQIAHLFITAVHKQYRGQGLSRQINFHAMNLAAIKKFTHMYCEFTNYFNEIGTIKYIHTEKRLIGSAVYREFEYDGKKPFDHLAHGANSFLWELEPNANLIYTEKDKKFIHTLHNLA